MVNGQSRLETRFNSNKDKLKSLKDIIGLKLNAEKAFMDGLITVIPDDLDWDDEIRLKCRRKNNIFTRCINWIRGKFKISGKETCETKIFGRLTAWQNWIFNRPNAVQ